MATRTAFGNRAKQTTQTQGTIPYAMSAGATAPLQTLKAAMIKRTGDAVGPWKVKRYYVADTIDYEIGAGTLTAGIPDTLSRDRIIESTNGNAAVNWGAGTRNVWLAPDASALDTLPGASEETTLTIAGGAVTPIGGLHMIDTEAAAATDDLDTIVQTNFDEGALIMIRCANAARVPTVRHNQGAAGKLILRDAANVVLDATTKTLLLKRVGTTWEETARYGFAAETDTINRFTKIQKWKKGADVASAATLTLGDDGNYFDITGTTGVTAIASKGVGTTVRLHFDGAVPITHHATNLVLAGAASYTTAAGDELEFTEYESGWRMTGYALASGRALVAPATVSAASQAEMEAASATGVFASPANLKYHPGVVKAWVNFNGTGTVAIRSSLSVTSITDNGTGDYTVNFTTAFSDANYCPFGMASDPSTQGAGYAVAVRGATAPTTTALRVLTGVSNSTPSDVPYVNVGILGDL